eukprot:m.118429 g.118429  ORF g.118429 m.118429 type:complete len:230 (-) comp17206_c0_seq1:157-846(-)
MAETDEARIDILSQQTKDMEQKFAVFVESATKKLTESKNSYKESIREDKENTEQLKHKIIEASEKQKRSHAVLEQRNKVVGAAETEVADLQKVESDIKTRADALDTRIAALNAKKAALMKSKQQQATQAGQRSSMLASGLEMYKEWLGLHFVRVDDEALCFTFTRIDPAEPERKFKFTIQVDGAGVYHVDKCSPVLDTDVIEPMLASLNKSNDFGGFVRQMRVEFKKLV